MRPCCLLLSLYETSNLAQAICLLWSHCLPVWRSCWVKPLFTLRLFWGLVARVLRLELDYLGWICVMLHCFARLVAWLPLWLEYHHIRASELIDGHWLMLALVESSSGRRQWRLLLFEWYYRISRRAWPIQGWNFNLISLSHRSPAFPTWSLLIQDCRL